MSDLSKVNKDVLDNYGPDSCFELTENAKIKKYFKKFKYMIRYLKDVARLDNQDDTYEYNISMKYLRKINNSFEALSMKYLFSGEVKSNINSYLAIDTTKSGFPNFKEFVKKESDLSDLNEKINSLPEEDELKEDMIDYMMKYKRVPRDLQFNMSQKLYYELLRDKSIFKKEEVGEVVVSNDILLLDWAVYDSSRNLPTVYLMSFEYSGEEINYKDTISELKRYVLTQSLSTLKMLTIAKAIDDKFDNIHPKILKRVHFGPMYSNIYTSHNKMITDLLEDLDEGRNWLFTWTTEIIQSDRQEYIKDGWFDKKTKEIFMIDRHNHEAVENGTTIIHRNTLMPYEVYQRKIDKNISNQILDESSIYIVDKSGIVTSV